jgi:hypothetical protein
MRVFDSHSHWRINTGFPCTSRSGTNDTPDDSTAEIFRNQSTEEEPIVLTCIICFTFQQLAFRHGTYLEPLKARSVIGSLCLAKVIFNNRNITEYEHV